MQTLYKSNKQVEVFKPKGHVKITIEDIETGKVRIIEKDNLLMDNGQYLLRDFLRQLWDNSYNLSKQGLKKLQIGENGSDSTNTSLNQLKQEIFRKDFTDVQIEGRKVHFQTFILSSDFTSTNIQEMGLIGYRDQTNPQTEILFSRVTFSTPFDKLQSEVMTVVWTIEF